MSSAHRPPERRSLLHPAYVSTQLRAPLQPMLRLPHTQTEMSGPLLGDLPIGPLDHDLTRHHGREALGERILVHGRVTDDAGRPVQTTLVEIWQANAAGRYADPGDHHPAPLDPNFTGAGRCVTDDEGRFQFITIKPGAYPWRNHPNAWRPAHIHFSFLGRSFAQRLVTQMYFPGDPLFAQDPIFNAVGDARARERLIAALDLSLAIPEWALAYRFDVVLTGPTATPLEGAQEHDD